MWSAQLVVAALSLVAVGAGAPPDDLSRFGGIWMTESGNQIEIKPVGDAWQGTLVDVTEFSSQFLHKGDVSVDQMSGSPRAVKFRMTFRDTDRPRDVCAPYAAPFTGKLSADGATIEGTYEDFDFSPTTNANGTVTGCTIIHHPGKTVTYRYVRPPSVCAEIPDRQGFKISAGPHTQLTVTASSEEPLGDEHAMLDVDVAALNGDKVPAAQVSWTVAPERGGTGATFFTETDSTGRARLQFIMLPDGQFAPTEQMTRPERTLPAGRYIVTAAVAALNLSLAQPLRVELKRAGVVIRLTDDGGNDIDHLNLSSSHNDGEFRVEVIDYEHTDSAGPSEIQISVSGNGTGPVSPTLTRHDARYSENKSFTVYQASYPHGAFNALSQHVVRLTGDVTDLTIYVPQFTATRHLKVYSSARAFAREAMLATLKQSEQVLSDVAASAARMTTTQRNDLDARLSLARKAREYVDDPRLRDGGILIAGKYLNVLRSRSVISAGRGTFGFVTNPLSLLGSETVVLSYDSEQEHTALRLAQKALEVSHDRLLEQMATDLDVQLRNGPQMLKYALQEAAAAPLLEGYALVWGVTLDGNDLDPVDRLFAGLDLAQFVLNSPPSVQIGKRLALKEKILRDVKKFAEKFGLKIGEPGHALVADVDYRLARLAQRMERARGSEALATVYSGNMATGLKERLRAAAEHIAGYRVIASLETRLAEEAASASMNPNLAHQVSGDIRMRIGILEHAAKRYESIAYWENEVTSGRAVAHADEFGRYRALTADGKLSKTEELMEWRITGTTKRIDTGLINHEEKTVCIIDRAAQYTEGHYRKGNASPPGSSLGAAPNLANPQNDYKSLVQKVFPDYKVTYFEYYWDEKAGDFVIGHVSR